MGTVQKWTVQEDASVSNHRLITFTIEFGPVPSTKITSRLNVSKVDFKTLNQDIQDRLTHSSLPLLDMEETATLVTTIARICKSNIPKAKHSIKSVPWWTGPEERTKDAANVESN